MAGKKESVASKVEKLAIPIAQRLGLEIWDIEYVREGASWYLRIFIDKEGGVSIDDCENFSRAIDGPLDEADPIDRQYCLEVSSPGIERELKYDRHFASQMGKAVRVRLIRPGEGGIRELEGRLTGFDGAVITIEGGEGPVSVKKSDTAYVRLSDTEDFA